MAITYRPKVGEILECDFGEWSQLVNFDGHIKPEMRKRRMVVILNGNLDGHSCLVVPISSSDSDQKGFSNKYHVILPTNFFTVTDYYDKRDRWALADRITLVSKERLFIIKNNGIAINQKLPADLVSEIQIQVINAINAKQLLK